MKVQDLKKYIDTLERIKECASRLHYYAKFRRVTHTVRQLRNLINEIALFKYQVDQSGDQLHYEFYDKFRKLMHMGQLGPSEIRLDVDGLYISGTFDPNILSRYILLASPPQTIYLAQTEVKNEKA